MKRNSFLVAHVSSSLTSSGAGVTEVVYQLSRHQNLGSSLHVVVVGLVDDCWANESSQWSDIETIPFSTIGPKQFGYAKNLTRTLVELNPDLVHLHGAWMYPAKAVLDWHRVTKRPYIISVHGMLAPVALSYGSIKKRIVSYLYQDDVFLNASMMHSTSHQESVDIMTYGLDIPVVQIPNGVVVPKFVRNVEPELKKVITLGRVHKKKGLKNLLVAWSFLESSFPDWELEIIGPDDGGELQILKNLAMQMKLRRVVFSGAVFGDAKWYKYHSASIFVLPTLSDNFAITVAESLACAVPVISSKGAPWEGLNEFKCGKWVEVGEYPLRKGLEEMMQLSSTERLEMGFRGRRWMENSFSWSKIATHFEIVYRDTIIKSTQDV
ncbi:glycosyltransferase [Limnobacter profundi]|uniref:Glycosyltransferase n=1 Tax=Limnobacter profundi TaxID=2732163 RepID=A0ABX6NBE5_9BURK|nr:glycosyltransferase [Limnobacter sp. SAORIC-580]QJR30727.1 glycosyltransferase [Limnobacter sp. SAORIC-580]